MKRSPLPPRRTPLKRGSTRLRRTPIARIGRKAKSKRAQRARVVAAVHARDRVCQFPIQVRPFGVNPGECSGPLDAHEIIPRSAWPNGELSIWNVILVCRAHHRWIDHHPTEAHDFGLHGYSWEVPRAAQ